MKQYLRIAAFCTMLLATAMVTKAQTRYLDEVFSDVTIDTTIQYGENYEFFTGFQQLKPLLMDVYYPTGDTATNRPVVLLSHNGSFLPEALTAQALGFCFKGRRDSSMVELCKRFARRGYVAISFDYRLGWNATSSDPEVRAKTIIQAVYRAMQDSKGLIRYLRSTHTNGNQWGIDPSKIVLGGSNSGAYVALAANSLNDTTELNQSKFVGTGGRFIQQDTIGDFEGFGGLQNHDNYSGFSSAYNVTLALGGAVGDTSWIQAGEGPVIAFHGSNETLTPYNTGIVVTSTGQPVIEVSGAGDFMPVYNRLGCNNSFLPNNFAQGPANRQNGVFTQSYEGLYPFHGQSFEPWNWYSCNLSINSFATKAKANLYIDTIMGYTAPRLYKQLIDNSYEGPTGIFEAKNDISMSVYPNPANNYLTVKVAGEQKPMASLQLVDITGRVVSEVKDVDAYTASVNVAELVNGIYTLNVKLTDGNTAARRIAVHK